MTRLSKREEDVRKGAWTAEEDNKLRAYVEVNGTGHWRSVGKKAGLQRCGKSCRLRWTNYLRPDIRHGSFTSEEEDLIIKLHAAYGSRWSLIAANMPGRTDNDIKNHWNTRLKKKLCNMGIDPVSHKPIAELLRDLAAGTMAHSPGSNMVAEQAAKRCFSDSLLNKAVREYRRSSGLSSRLYEVTTRNNLSRNEEESDVALGDDDDDAFELVRSLAQELGADDLQEHSNNSGSNSMAESSCSEEANISRGSDHHQPGSHGQKTSLQKKTPLAPPIIYTSSALTAGASGAELRCGRITEPHDTSAAAATAVNPFQDGTSTHAVDNCNQDLGIMSSLDQMSSQSAMLLRTLLQSSSRVQSSHDHEPAAAGGILAPAPQFGGDGPTTTTIRPLPMNAAEQSSANDYYTRYLALRNAMMSQQAHHVPILENLQHFTPGSSTTTTTTTTHEAPIQMVQAQSAAGRMMPQMGEAQQAEIGVIRMMMGQVHDSHKFRSLQAEEESTKDIEIINLSQPDQQQQILLNQDSIQLDHPPASLQKTSTAAAAAHHHECGGKLGGASTSSRTSSVSSSPLATAPLSSFSGTCLLSTPKHNCTNAPSEQSNFMSGITNCGAFANFSVPLATNFSGPLSNFSGPFSNFSGPFATTGGKLQDYDDSPSAHIMVQLWDYHE